MSNENFLYDFEYMMNVLEENWPFFNLSIGTNGVDVHEVADNMRSIINNAPPETCPHDFLDLLREHFMWPIGQIGHLCAFWQYESFFDTVRGNNRVTRIMGVEPYDVAMNREIIARPQTVMFYNTLRDAGGTTPASPSPPLPENLSVLEMEILEEGRIAYVKVNRMINLWDDIRVPGSRTDHYQNIVYTD